MKQTLKHFFRLLDITLGLLFCVWSIHVFKGILGKGYSAYNEPNRKLAKFEMTTAIVLLFYVIVRGFQYIRGMFRKGK